MSNYIQKCLNGEALLDDVDDFVDEWHNTQGEVPIYQYLGMTRSEYSTWVVDPDVLAFIIIARQQQKSLDEVLDEFNPQSLAARSDSPQKAEQLIHWLKKEGLWEE